MNAHLLALDKIRKGQSSASKLETSTLDFKQEKREKRETYQDMAEAAVCFANAAGGVVILGVADKGTGSEAFVGTDLPADQIKERIYTLTQPNLLVDVEELHEGERRLLAIKVPSGLDVYQTQQTSPTRRLNDSCLHMTPSETSRLHDERRGADWSAESSARLPSEIPDVSIQRLRSLLSQVSSTSIRDLAEKSAEDLLGALHLVHKSGHLTNAGEMLLCRPVNADYLEMVVYQHRPTTGGEADFVRRWGAPLIAAFPEAMEAISNRIGITPVTASSGQQIQIEDYPLTAIREALANGLMHGDHRERRPVLIEHSPEQLTVRSPGPLVAGILPTNILTHPSKPRFQALSEAFRVIGLAEKLGQGVDRMFREMIRSGKSAPKVEESGNGAPETTISFAGGPPNSRVARFLATLPVQEQNDTDTLLITTMLCDKKTVTAQTVSAVIQRDLVASEAVLRRLATGEAHLLETTAGTSARSHPSYRLQREALVSLGPAVKYQKRSVKESDSKVQEHLRDYGNINSRTIQRLFDVDVFQARDMLRDLLGREILVRISEQSRGTAVKYGPGPKFPSRKFADKAPDMPDEDRLF